MKKLFLLPILLISSTLVRSQPVITNAEDFDIGTVLTFQKCNTTGVSAGNSGANQTWDFSMLPSLPDITTEWMLDPSTTTNGNLFPTANLVVKVSNGQFTYVNKTINENNIIGFVDTTSTFPATQYPNPMLIAKRPLEYGIVVADTFTLSGSTALGIVTLDPDAYGTLILPNGTYNNVLRVKISQVHPWFTYNVHVWFNGTAKSALLKIDDQPNVEYLLSETTVGVAEIKKQEVFTFHPNPTRNQLLFDSENRGELIIKNNKGQIVSKTLIKDKRTNISTLNFIPGVYHLIFTTENSISTSKLIIQ